VDPLGLTHGGFEEQRVDVVPVLLKERDQEVDLHEGVLPDLVLVHLDVTDLDTHTENLLKLELDVGPDLVLLILKNIGLGDHGGELTLLVKTGT